MGIEVASSFTRKAGIPLDDLSVVADLTARDAIEAGVRYEGMVVYVVAEATNFQLIGGIGNEHWEEFSGSGGGGGAGALEFYSIDGINSPADSYVGLLKTKAFEHSTYQYLFFKFTVPMGYKPGQVISFKGAKCFVNSTDSSKDFALRTRVVAIGDGDPAPTDVDTDLDSQVPSLGAVQTTSNVTIELGPLLLTDADGQVDANDLAPGKVIFGAIYRDPTEETDTVPADVHLDLASLQLDFKTELP